MKSNSLLLLTGLAGIAAAASAGGCSPPKDSLNNGLHVEYMDFQNNEEFDNKTTEQERALYEEIFASLDRSKPTDTANATDINFSGYLTSPSRTPDPQPLYGKTVDYRQAALRYTGYIYAETTGQYTISFPYGNDAAIFSVGAEKAMECCKGTSLKPYSKGDSDYFLVAYTGGTPDFPTTTQTYSFEQGVYYPIKILFFNHVGSPIGLSLEIITPSGKKLTGSNAPLYYLSRDLAGNVGDTCPTHSSSMFSSSSAPPSSSSTPPSSSSAPPSSSSAPPSSSPPPSPKIPPSSSSTPPSSSSTPPSSSPPPSPKIPPVTFTTPWTGTTTRTVTHTPDKPGDPTSYEVDTPGSSPSSDIPPVTFTTPWTGSTTRTITHTPSKPGDPTTYEVDTPSKPFYFTIPWTGTTTRTITHTPSKPGDPTTYEIDTPYSGVPTCAGHGTCTCTNTWTGSVTKTVTVTPSSPSEPVIVVVNCPKQEGKGSGETHVTTTTTQDSRGSINVGTTAPQTSDLRSSTLVNNGSKGNSPAESHLNHSLDSTSKRPGKETDGNSGNGKPKTDSGKNPGSKGGSSSVQNSHHQVSSYPGEGSKRGISALLALLLLAF